MRSGPPAGAVGVVLVMALLAGCAGPAALPAPTVHGPAGYRFSASISEPLTLRTIRGGTDAEGQTLYGTSVATRWIWTGGTTSVWIDRLTHRVRPGRLPYLLRSYLPSGPSGRWLTTEQDPAMIGVVPGCIPSGQCSGFVGGLVILDGQTIYDMTTSQSTPTATEAVLHSFRIVHG